jgi:hypothetical protein
MDDRIRLLYKNSENISNLIALMTLHEENINRDRDTRTFEIDMQLISLLAPMLNTTRVEQFDISSILHNITCDTFSSLENPLNAICPITQDAFLPTDQVIMINSCRHTFKRNSLLRWLNRQQTCPCCRISVA